MRANPLISGSILNFHKGWGERPGKGLVFGSPFPKREGGRRVRFMIFFLLHLLPFFLPGKPSKRNPMGLWRI